MLRRIQLSKNISKGHFAETGVCPLGKYTEREHGHSRLCHGKYSSENGKYKEAGKILTNQIYSKVRLPYSESMEEAKQKLNGTLLRRQVTGLKEIFL